MNIVVTGASRGIGYELVKQFTKHGDHSISCLSRNIDALIRLKEECASINPEAKVLPILLDLSDMSQIDSFVDSLKKDNFPIDILINNAGYLKASPFEQLALDDIEKMYQVNIIRPMMLIKGLLPLLRKAKIAHIVNISSMGGFQGTVKFPGLAPYASSKAAIASLTECLAEEYKETNLRFNCLALGAVATEMLEEAFPGYKAPTTALQMAEFIADFAMNGAKMFNGKILPVSSTTP